MGILSFNTDVAGQVGNYIGGVVPRRVTIVSTDNLSAVTAGGYLNNFVRESGFVILPTDIIEMWYGWISSNNPGTFATFTPSISNGVISLVEQVSLGNVLLPVVSGNIANFNGATGQIKDSGIASSSLITNSNSSGQTVSTSNSSATPGTVRAFVGSMTSTQTTITSGNLVGVRGVTNMVGISGGYIYGTQGKIIATGTISNSGGGFEAGVLGQFDVSAATLGSTSYMAPIWGDWGGSAPSGTYAQCYGIAMTNSTAAILGAQVYLYGNATNLMNLAGASTPGYYVSAGTSSGSAGNSSHCAAQQVLVISIQGATVYIPVFTQNT